MMLLRCYSLLLLLTNRRRRWRFFFYYLTIYLSAWCIFIWCGMFMPIYYYYYYDYRCRTRCWSMIPLIGGIFSHLLLLHYETTIRFVYNTYTVTYTTCITKTKRKKLWVNALLHVVFLCFRYFHLFIHFIVDRNDEDMKNIVNQWKIWWQQTTIQLCLLKIVHFSSDFVWCVTCKWMHTSHWQSQGFSYGQYLKWMELIMISSSRMQRKRYDLQTIRSKHVFYTWVIWYGG